MQPVDHRMNVLLVDDRPENLLSLEAVLAELGQNLVTAASGEEALRILLNDQFAVILLDVEMPGMGGVETAALIRARELSKSTPIIFLTEHDPGSVLTFEGYSAAAVDYLFKPLAPETLTAKVSVFVELARQREALERAQYELELRFQERTERLRQSEERFRLLVEGTKDYAIFMLDPQGRIASWNLGATFMYGYSVEEAVGQHFTLVYSAEEIARGHPQEELRAALADGRYTEEGWRVRKDGSKFWASSVLKALVDAEGNLRGYGKVVHDLTDRRAAADALRQSEEQLRQSQKMEAIGRLAGGVAHDFNNMLSVINGYSELLQQRPDLDAQMRERLGEIQHAGERAAGLTRQLLAFSRKQVLEPRLFDVNRLVADTEKMLRHVLGEDIQLAAVLENEPCSVLMDPGQMEQVLMNLVVNARDAMPQGGRITIETHRVELADDYGSQHFEVTPGPYVMLAVTDTGCGIDRETQRRIFDPFFTTKEVGKGTGLGLATVYGIVKQSDGDIYVYSELGVGTTFKIYLPLVLQDLDRPPQESAAPRTVSAGTETILLVEDEDMVRRFVSHALSIDGYTVLEALQPADALKMAQEYQGPIHLLLTDVVMPAMSGGELAERLGASRPGIKVAYMSGYTDDAVVRHGILSADAAFIQKPFSPRTLSRKVREVLDGVKAGGGVDVTLA